MTMITRFRDRRQSHRRSRAIARALESAKTPSLQHELQTLMARHLR